MPLYRFEKCGLAVRSPREWLFARSDGRAIQRGLQSIPAQGNPDGRQVLLYPTAPLERTRSIRRLVSINPGQLVVCRRLLRDRHVGGALLAVSRRQIGQKGSVRATRRRDDAATRRAIHPPHHTTDELSRLLLSFPQDLSLDLSVVHLAPLVG